jgi:hypothetical protein
MRRFPEARLLRTEVLAAHRRHWGEEDPETLVAEEWLALNLANSGLTEDARPLLMRIYQVRLRTLGLEHKDTKQTKRFLERLARPADE